MFDRKYIKYYHLCSILPDCDSVEPAGPHKRSTKPSFKSKCSLSELTEIREAVVSKMTGTQQRLGLYCCGTVEFLFILPTDSLQPHLSEVKTK